MGDPVPVRASGPRTLVRYCPSTRIPLPSHAAAAACLPTSDPPAIRHPPYRALPVSRTRQGPLPVPHDTSRHDLAPATPPPGRHGVSAPRRPSWPSVVRLRPRATAKLAYGAFAMRRPPMLQLRSEALGQHSVLPSHAGLFVPATSPVATVIAGHLSTVSPRRHQQSSWQSACRHWPEGRFGAPSLPVSPQSAPLRQPDSDGRQARSSRTRALAGATTRVAHRSRPRPSPGSAL